MNFDILADIKIRAQKKTIHELRQIARAVGVVHPADGKKERLVDEIVKIASCQIQPAPRSARGAPPKSSEYDKDLVADIEDCIAYYTALKYGKEIVSDEIRVSDGTTESNCSGILVKREKYFFLRVNGCFASQEDVFVHESYVTRFGLEEGDKIEGVKMGKPTGGAPALTAVTSVNGWQPYTLKRIPFGNLTGIYPHKRIRLSSTGQTALRMVDLFSPLGLGQRALICGPANSGKTMLLMQIAREIIESALGLRAVILLNAARPEEITLFRRELPEADIFYTSFADDAGKIVEAAEFVFAYCKRQTECGANVVLLSDGLYQLETASRKVGADSAAKRLLSCAICAEEGCSLTVIASAYSNEADFIGELSQAANLRVNMSGNAVFNGIFPAIDILNTSTVRPELLQTERELKAAKELRRKIVKNGYCAAEMDEIIELFEKTKNNEQLIKEILNG